MKYDKNDMLRIAVKDTEGNNVRDPGTFESTKYNTLSVSAGEDEIACHNLDGYIKNTLIPKRGDDNNSTHDFPMRGIKFSQIAAGSYYSMCGILKGDHVVKESKLGATRRRRYQVYDKEKKTYKSDQGIPEYQYENVMKLSGSVHCWNIRAGREAVVEKVPANITFKEVHVSLIAGQHMCGIVAQNGTATPPPTYDNLNRPGQHSAPKFYEEGATVCWGYSPEEVPNEKFISLSLGEWHACGVVKETQETKCWPLNAYYGNKANQASVPKGIKWLLERSCMSSHPTVSGPAGCTSCDRLGCNPHFTIINPKTNTGTCTSTLCPTCKPKVCCGAEHKHYVLNTRNLEGVCVRHDDDCTPICVPQGIDNPKIRRVCTKGCNQLLKVIVDPKASSESNMYEMVTCQADKRVLCEPYHGASTDELGETIGATWFAPHTTRNRKSENDATLLGEEADVATLPYGIKDNAVVTIKGGKYGHFCHGRMVCNRLEEATPYYVSRLKDGFVAFNAGAEKFSESPPESALMHIEDAGNGTVALKSRKTGKYCTGSEVQDMTCDSMKIGTEEKFTITVSTKAWPKNTKYQNTFFKKTSSSKPLQCSALKPTASSQGNSCKTSSVLKAKVLCPYRPELWALGATCVTNLVHNVKNPNCPGLVKVGALHKQKLKNMLSTLCRNATTTDDMKCSRLGMAF